MPCRGFRQLFLSSPPPAPEQGNQGNFIPCFLHKSCPAELSKFTHLFCLVPVLVRDAVTGKVFQLLHAAPSTLQNNRTQPENNTSNKGGRRNRPRDLELETYPALTKIQEKHKELLGPQDFSLATWDRSELQPEECAGLGARHSPSQP